MRTTDIFTALGELDEAPWGDLDGRALDARRLARLLDPYGVHPTPYKDDGKTVLPRCSSCNEISYFFETVFEPVTSEDADLHALVI